MTNETDLQSVEITIEQAKAQIENMQALDRLRKNKDFIALIETGFLKDEASRVVLALAEPALQADDQQKQLYKMIDACGYLRQYLNRIYQFGHHAEGALASHEDTRNELMSEIA